MLKFNHFFNNKNRENIMKNILLDFMKQAGKIALDYQKNMHSENNYFKAESVTTVVTEADLAISSLLYEFLSANMPHNDYVVIDEETLKNLGEDKFKTAAAKTYQIVLDPIDGTLPYSLGMPFYGVSLGILKNMKPYMGAVYIPSLGEMAICDGEKVEYKKNVFTKDEISTEIKTMNDKAVVFFPKQSVLLDLSKLDRKHDIEMNLYSAVVHEAYIISGRAKAYYFNVSLWDMAGSWASLKKIGAKFLNLETGEEMTEFSPKFFDGNLKIKTPHIICSPKDFDKFKSIWVNNKK